MKLVFALKSNQRILTSFLKTFNYEAFHTSIFLFYKMYPALGVDLEVSSGGPSNLRTIMLIHM